MKPRKKNRNVISVGRETAEIKIYTKQVPSSYTSYQCCWYDLGKRQSRTFSKLPEAKLFAQQKSVALANGIPVINEATLRDVEVMKSCESRASKLGFTLPAAMEEWFSARQSLLGVSLAEDNAPNKVLGFQLQHLDPAHPYLVERGLTRILIEPLLPGSVGGYQEMDFAESPLASEEPDIAAMVIVAFQQLQDARAFNKAQQQSNANQPASNKAHP